MNQSSNQDDTLDQILDRLAVDAGRYAMWEAVPEAAEAVGLPKPTFDTEKAKAAILKSFRSVQAIREAIGKDEWNPLPKRNNYVGIRNSLRRELRTKLNLEES